METAETSLIIWNCERLLTKKYRTWTRYTRALTGDGSLIRMLLSGLIMIMQERQYT